MRRAILASLVLVTALGMSCVGSESTSCGPNIVCPRGLLCEQVGQTFMCVSPEALIPCAGQADRTLCELGGRGGYHCLNEICVLGQCGDGYVDLLEQCDNGAAQNSDTEPNVCRTTCYLPRCNDGVVDSLFEEVCDDGNNASGDGCSGDCKSIETCGDGVVNPPFEICDEGTANSNDPNAECRDDCQPGRCGDGILDSARGEDCDENQLAGETCESLGRYPGTLACGDTCRFDLTGCSGYCGDGVKNGPAGSEDCDGADLDGLTCTTLVDPYYLGTLSCLPNCRFGFADCSGKCGDGARNGSELCDGSDFGVETCTARGFYSGTLDCSASCDAIDDSGCVGYCGDSAVNGPEQCDGADLQGLACRDFSNYTAGGLLCVDDCSRSLDACFRPEWSLETSGTTLQLRSVWGSSFKNVISVGDSGTILHFDGEDWTAMTSPTTNRLRAVWGSSSTNVWAVGDSGTILHFDGDGWSGVTSPTSTYIYGLWGTGSANVYAAAQGQVLRYDGTAWTEIDTIPSPPAYRAIWGSSASDIFVVGGLGRIVHNSGGPGWAEHSTPTSELLNYVWGTGPSDVYAVGRNGTILHYNGSVWSAMTSGTTEELYTIWGGRYNDVYAAGADGTLLRYDGTSWIRVTTNSTEELYSVWGSSSADVFAVGSLGEILHFRGRGFGVEHPTMTGFPAAVWGSGPDDVFVAVQNLSTVHHYDGRGWSAQSASSTFEAIYGFSSDDVYAVGQDRIWHYNGASWSQVSQASGSWLRAVWGSAPDDVFAGGSDGMIRHYDGSSWSTMPTNTTSTFYSFWGTASDDVYAVTAFGWIRHYNGSSWSMMYQVPGVNCGGVWGSSADNILVACNDGVVARYDGASWSTASVGTSEDLTAIWGTSAYDVWVVGNAGTVLRYDGWSWAPVQSDTADYLVAIWGSSPFDVYVVGNTLHHFRGALSAPARGRDGDACTADTDCRNGSCLNEGSSGVPGGICAQAGCDITPCNDAGTRCVDFGGTVGHRCWPECSHQVHCRSGYACMETIVGTLCLADCDHDRQCATGTCNKLTGFCENDGADGRVGDACVDSTDCEGALCITSFTGGYCTSDCSVELDNCPVDSACIKLWSDYELRGGCMKRCLTSADCRSGYSCIEGWFTFGEKICYQ